MDLQITQGYLEIDLDKEHKLPKTMKLVVLTGVKGEGGNKKGKQRDLGDEEHVAFTFNYNLSNYSDVEPFLPPREVGKILK